MDILRSRSISGIQHARIAVELSQMCGALPPRAGGREWPQRSGKLPGRTMGDKWVFRAGYGLTNDPYYGIEIVRANYPILTQLNVESPDGLTPVATLEGGIPAITVPPPGNGIIDIPGNYAWGGYPKDFKRGYIQSWNFTVQRELPWKFTGQIGYVGTHSTRQLGLRDINAGQVIGAGEDGRPLVVAYGRTATTTFLQPVGSGQYNSMQAQLHRRFADGLSLNVNYTLARGKSDNENSSFTPNVQALAYSSRNYALVSTDRLHNLGINSSWELPFGPERRWLHDGGVLSYIVGGWQVNNTFSMSRFQSWNAFLTARRNP